MDLVILQRGPVSATFCCSYCLQPHEANVSSGTDATPTRRSHRGVGGWGADQDHWLTKNWECFFQAGKSRNIKVPS